MAAGAARSRAGAGVARRAGLTRPAFVVLLAGVLVAHVVALDQVRDALEQPSALREMPVVMYTRTLAPAAPPPPPTIRAARKAPPAKQPSPVAPKREEPPPAVASEPEPKVPEPPVAETSPAPAEPAAETAKGADLSGWPADTRLTYRLGGEFRGGPLFGDANVQWQRDGAKYQVRAEVNVTPWAHLVMTSQGDVQADGLSPTIYEEESRGRKRRRASFEPGFVRLDNGQAVPRPPLVQDTASQFVELGHRFASGRVPLRAGEPVTVWLARPGGVDQWTYDVSGPEPVATPKLGAVEAFHLKPRPIANPRGNIYAELWFAPGLQYLPVRIKLLMGEADYIDLAIEAIEQR